MDPTAEQVADTLSITFRERGATADELRRVMPLFTSQEINRALYRTLQPAGRAVRVDDRKMLDLIEARKQYAGAAPVWFDRTALRSLFPRWDSQGPSSPLVAAPVSEEPNVPAVAAAAQKPAIAPAMVVVVDLGNSPLCLKVAEQHTTSAAEAAPAKVHAVMAFADHAFNGYGVNPPAASTAVYVLQASEPCRNAIAVSLVWTLATYATSMHDRPHHFVLCTRDEGYGKLESLLTKARGVHPDNWVTFCRDVQSLREVLE